MSLSDEEDTIQEMDPTINALRDNIHANNRTALASRVQHLRSSDSEPLNEPVPVVPETERQAEIQALIEAAVSGMEEAALSKTRNDSEESDGVQDRTLVDACTRRDVQAVRNLLQTGWSANDTTDEGESLLSLACSSGQYELVEVLLQHNANLEDCGTKGECTPLMEASSGGYAKVVQLLLNHGANVNATSSTGNTALTYASCGGFVDVVKILVEAGAELESPNENGHTPLMEAASGGHVNVAALLLERGAGINTSSHEFKESALTLACYKGHLPMVKFLLKAGADQEHKTDEMHTALMEASMDGHVDVAKLLLDSGAQVNMPTDSFESPLTLAACGGHVELAQLLISRGAALEEVNDEGYTAIMEASREGHEDMVQLLIQKGCSVNAKTEETQETALTLACCGGFLEVVEQLVEGGAKIELGSSTPLMEAAQEGQIEVVKYLIEKGADVKATTKSDDTALHFACEQGHTDIAEILLNSNADLEYKTECGRTPLMKASRAGHLCTVQFLIGQGANVNNVTNNNDHSVLSLACSYGHTNVVETLLCQGADPSYKLKDDANMLIEACRNGHTNVAKLLLEFPQNYVAVSPDTQAGEGMVNVEDKISISAEDGSTYGGDNESVDFPASVGNGTAPVPQVAPNPVSSPPPAAAASPGAGAVVTPPNPPTPAPICSHLHPHFDEAVAWIPPTSMDEFKEGMNEQVTKLIQHGSWLTQAAEGYLPPEAKEEVEKDVTRQIERFLRTMANDPSVGLALVEGNCKELEARVMKAVEKQFYALYGEKSPQIMRQILQDKKPTDIGDRGNPDGVDSYNVDGQVNHLANAPNFCDFPVAAEGVLSETSSKNVQTGTEQGGATCYNTLNNGSSGCISQGATASSKDDDNFCQCPHRSCLPGDVTDDQEDDQTSSNDEAADSLLQTYRQPEIDACTESNHDTPLTLACAGGYEELVKLLLSKNANVEHRDKKGFTPLILAATAGHVGVVALLVSDKKADLEAQSDRTKDTPLSLACSGGRMEVVQLLLNNGANKEHRNVSDYTPLSLAASGGYVNIIKLLLQHGAEINSRTGSKLGISPLMLAAMNGHTQAVQLLLDMGADINAQIETNRNTALTLACFQGRHEVVSLLVDRKANVEHRAKTGLTPLMEAASGGYAEVGKVLLDKGADPNAAPVPSSRDTALTIAADKGHIRFCELILSHKAQVEVKNKKGNTSLWLACNGGHLDVVELLVKNGADVNAHDNRNCTPLFAAFKKGWVKVVSYMANVVSQFPSESECDRFIQSIMNNEKEAELKKRLEDCKACIEESKSRQAEEANNNAARLLDEVEHEKVTEEKRKQRQAKKREKKKQKKRQRQMDKKGDSDPKKDGDFEFDDGEYPEGSAAGADEDGDESRLGFTEPESSATTYTAATSQLPSATSVRAVVSSKSTPTTITIVAPSPLLATAATTTVKTSSVKQQRTVASSTSLSSSSLVIAGLRTPSRSSDPPPSSSSSYSIPHSSPPPLQKTTNTSPRSSNASSSRKSKSAKTQQTSSSSSSSSSSSLLSSLRASVVPTSSSSTSSSSASQAKSVQLRVANSVPSYVTSLAKTSLTSSPSSSSSPNKRTSASRRSDEAAAAAAMTGGASSAAAAAGGWEKVNPRNKSSDRNSVRLYVNSRLISRLIGRGGCNINAIREATGAHIDIDKQRKGSQERTVTIKGTPEAQKHAEKLILKIIDDEGGDSDVQEIISQMQQASLSGALSNGEVIRNSPAKPHMQVIEAPIPVKSAWKVPPAIVSKSNAPWANSAAGGGGGSATCAPALTTTCVISTLRSTAPSLVYTNSSLKSDPSSATASSPAAIPPSYLAGSSDGKAVGEKLIKKEASGAVLARKNLFPQAAPSSAQPSATIEAASTAAAATMLVNSVSCADEAQPKSPPASTADYKTSATFSFPLKTGKSVDKPIQPVIPMLKDSSFSRPTSNTASPSVGIALPPSSSSSSQPDASSSGGDVMMKVTSSKPMMMMMSPPSPTAATTCTGDGDTMKQAAFTSSSPPAVQQQTITSQQQQAATAGKIDHKCGDEAFIPPSSHQPPVVTSSSEGGKLYERFVANPHQLPTTDPLSSSSSSLPPASSSMSHVDIICNNVPHMPSITAAANPIGPGFPAKNSVFMGPDFHSKFWPDSTKSAIGKESSMATSASNAELNAVSSAVGGKETKTIGPIGYERRLHSKTGVANDDLLGGGHKMWTAANTAYLPYGEYGLSNWMDSSHNTSSSIGNLSQSHMMMADRYGSGSSRHLSHHHHHLAAAATAAAAANDQRGFMSPVSKLPPPSNNNASDSYPSSVSNNVNNHQQQPTVTGGGVYGAIGSRSTGPHIKPPSQQLPHQQPPSSTVGLPIGASRFHTTNHFQQQQRQQQNNAFMPLQAPMSHRGDTSTSSSIHKSGMLSTFHQHQQQQQPTSNMMSHQQQQMRYQQQHNAFPSYDDHYSQQPHKLSNNSAPTSNAPNNDINLWQHQLNRTMINRHSSLQQKQDIPGSGGGGMYPGMHQQQQQNNLQQQHFHSSYPAHHDAFNTNDMTSSSASSSSAANNLFNNQPHNPVAPPNFPPSSSRGGDPDVTDHHGMSSFNNMRTPGSAASAGANSQAAAAMQFFRKFPYPHPSQHHLTNGATGADSLLGGNNRHNDVLESWKGPSWHMG